MSEDHAYTILVAQAKNRDKQALEDLIRAVQAYGDNLAGRMVSSPSDAEDATQEILIKVITHLSPLPITRAATLV